MKDKVHTLPSFSTFINKVFDFRSYLPNFTDARRDPEIAPSTIFLAMFHSFIFRLPSMQQLETDLANSSLQRWIETERPFRDDTLRYSLAGFDLQPLQDLLVDINRRLKRAKVFYPGRVQGRIVAALDGVEVLSSFSRRCDSCLQRRVSVRDQTGRKVEQIQYYHRAVACQIINSPVKPILALEWLQPGESEDAAALRLLRRLPTLYGSIFFDILLMDALYAQTPILKLVQQTGWDVVISLKQNLSDLYHSAQRLFNHRDPDRSYTEQKDGKRYDIQLWDSEGLPFSNDNPEPIRVVRSQEVLTRNYYREGKVTPHTTHHEWLWLTTLDPKQFSAAQVRSLGHDRWKQENNGWNDLTQNWAFKHGFLHACRHRPKSKEPAANSEPQLVSNRGLPAVTLILLIAFALISAFALRHSKLVAIYQHTTLAVSRQLYASGVKSPPPIRGPD